MRRRAAATTIPTPSITRRGARRAARRCATTTGRRPPIRATASPTIRRRAPSASGCSSTTAFSGRLLEGDNDGAPRRWGCAGRGGPGRAARAATCPRRGFVDTRSPHTQVSLAAQWTLRRTPTLLEVGFAPLFNWDGRRDALWNQALGVMESNRRVQLGAAVRRASRSSACTAPSTRRSSARCRRSTTRRASRALAPETTGCIEVITLMGSKFTCRGMPGDGADYDGMRARGPDAGHHRGRQRDQGHRRLPAPAALRPGPLRPLARRRRDGAVARRAARRGAVRRARPAASPATAARCLTDGAVPQRGAGAGRGRRRDPRRRRSRRRRRASPPRSTDPLSTRGRVQRRRSPRAARGGERRRSKGAFRTPTLRCTSQQPSFMHTAQMTALDQVVAFFDRGGDRVGGYPGTSEIAALGLTRARARRSRGVHGRARRARAGGGAAGSSREAARVRSGGARGARGVWRRRRRRLAPTAPRARAGPADGGPALPDAGMLPDVPFARPDASYVPSPGTCGFDAPAFCETSRPAPPAGGGRSGELDPARWSVARGQPYNSASFDDAIRVGPALIGACRADLSNARVLPDPGRAGLRSDRDRPHPPRAGDGRRAELRPRDVSHPPAVRLRGPHGDDQARHGSDEQRPRRLARARSSPRTHRPRPASTGRSAAPARATASRSSSARAGATRRRRWRRSSTRSTTTCRRRTSRRSTARSRTPPPRPARSTTSRSTSPRRTSRCGRPTSSADGVTLPRT